MIIILIIIIYLGYERRMQQRIDNKVNDLDDKFKSVGNTINDLDDKFESMNNKLNNITNKLETINNKIYSVESFLVIYSLISNNQYYNIFEDLMNEGIKKCFGKKIKKYNLLYLASRDGYDAKDFHKKCDGKSFTVTLVITKENKIFGGFTELEWDQSGKSKEGSKGFIFSITNNKIYYNINHYFIDNKNLYGPSFDNWGFYIKSNYGYDETKNYGSSFDVSGEEYVLAGELKFLIKDYAVYQTEME